MFERTTAIPYASVTRYPRGNAEADEVANWNSVSSSNISQIMFSLEPDGSIRHSHTFGTMFAVAPEYRP
jgi:hypothetical protein